MKRLLKILARLYPSDWRKRYGVEYDALLEQGTPRARDAFDVLRAAVEMQVTNWSLVKVVLPCAICGALLTGAISFAISPQYFSRTLIRITVDDEVARSKDDTVARDTAIALLPDALSETSLAAIIQELNLYPRERVRMSQKDLINQMRKDISIRPVRTGLRQDAFLLQFSYPDPHIVQKVDGELTSAMLTSAFRMRQNHSPSLPAGVETLRLETDASLPQPLFPKRGVFGAGGLAAGIAGGLLVVFMRRCRETVAVS